MKHGIPVALMACLLAACSLSPTPTANVPLTQTRAAEVREFATLTAPSATAAATHTPPPPTPVATSVPPTQTPTAVPPTATPTKLPPAATTRPPTETPPAPTATSAPDTPTPAPTPTPMFQATDRIGAPVPVNLRAGPGTNFATLGLLPPGTLLAATGESASSGGFLWRHFRLADGRDGWVRQADVLPVT